MLRSRLISCVAAVQLAFDGAVAVPYCCQPFFARGIDSIRRRNLNTFTLIALGVSAAFAYSIIATLALDMFPAQMGDEHGMVAA